MTCHRLRLAQEMDCTLVTGFVALGFGRIFGGIIPGPIWNTRLAARRFLGWWQGIANNLRIMSLDFVA